MQGRINTRTDAPRSHLTAESKAETETHLKSFKTPEAEPPIDWDLKPSPKKFQSKTGETNRHNMAVSQQGDYTGGSKPV